MKPPMRSGHTSDSTFKSEFALWLKRLGRQLHNLHALHQRSTCKSSPNPVERSADPTGHEPGSVAGVIQSPRKLTNSAAIVWRMLWLGNEAGMTATRIRHSRSLPGGNIP